MADIVLKVLEIRIVLPGNQPILLLLHQQSQRLLRLWIGPSEGTAIGLAQQGIDTPRPTTHQLLVDALRQAGDPLQAVRISKVDEEVFYAELILTSGTTVDSRASDAVASALLLVCGLCDRHRIRLGRRFNRRWIAQSSISKPNRRDYGSVDEFRSSSRPEP